jgi:hypothetical protein
MYTVRVIGLSKAALRRGSLRAAGWLLLLLVPAFQRSLPAQSAAGSGAAACDEICLKGFMDRYLQALEKHDSAALPLAAHYRYTENGAALVLGSEGLWATFNSYGKYRHDAFDVQTGGVASYLSILENREIPFPDLLAVRLKVVDRRISEIETVVDRHARGAANLPPQDPSWMQIMERVEPQATRLSRAALEKGALGYLRSVAFHDESLAPYAQSCIRLENGNVTAIGPHDTPPVPIGLPPTAVPGEPPRPNLMGIGCGKQLDYRAYSFITGYEDARFPLVDVSRQLVFAVFDFMRRGDVESWTYEGHHFAMPEGMRYPNEILNTEMFKFVDGKITRVEAVFEGPQAYKRGTGWPGGTPAESRPVGK